MGFRDYYRQFDDLDEDRLNRERRARRAEEKRQALERVPDARPVRHRVARDASLRDRERGDRPCPRPRQRLPRPARRGRPPPACGAPRRRPGADRLRQRRRRAAPGRRACPARRGRRAADALAVVSALSPDGGARRRPPAPLRPREHLLDEVGEHTRARRDLQPERPDGSPRAGRGAARTARGAAGARARAARRGARPLPGRRGRGCLPRASRRLSRA